MDIDDSDIKIKLIDKTNLEEALKLDVNNEQHHFIETVEDSVNEAKVRKFWKTACVYYKEDMVGFAMYGLYKGSEPYEYWIDRFLIDKKYQHKGLGKKSFEKLISKIKDEDNPETIYLSVYEENEIAINLYKKLGFNFNGQLDINGELVMTKELN